MPLQPQRLYYAAIIATCQVRPHSRYIDTLQLSRSSVVRSYLSPTPVSPGLHNTHLFYIGAARPPKAVSPTNTLPTSTTIHLNSNMGVSPQLHNYMSRSRLWSHPPDAAFCQDASIAPEILFACPNSNSRSNG